MKKEHTGYGWIIFAIFCLGAFTYQYTQYQLSIVSGDLITTLGLNATQFSSIFSSPMVPAIFFSIIFGVIADKVGMKTLIALAMLLSCIGGIGHVYASSYGSLYAMMLLTGFGAVAVNVTCGKMFSMWIKPELISVVMGAFLAASTIGQFVAQATTVFLGTFRTAFWVSAILCCVVFLLWTMFGKDKKEQRTIQEKAPSIGETLKVVLSSKNMWLCAIGLFLILGCQVAFNIWIPTALISKGMTPAQAGLVASIVSFGNLCGALFMPMLAAKVGKDKPFILVFILVCAVGYSFGWHLNGIVCYISFFIFGLCAAALMPFFISMPLKFKEIGPRYAGTAIGFTATIELLGAVVLPTYLIQPFALKDGVMNFSIYYYAIGIAWLLAFVIAILIPETAIKKTAKAKSLQG